jgi:hypothetical protein
MRNRIDQLEIDIIGWKHDCQARDHKIEQLEVELKNKDAVRLWNENEKLKEANRILRDGLELQSSLCECGTTTQHFPNGEHRGIDLHDEIEKALEQADKIMEGG